MRGPPQPLDAMLGLVDHLGQGRLVRLANSTALRRTTGPRPGCALGHRYRGDGCVSGGPWQNDEAPPNVWEAGRAR
jgi:hypothetical protein